MITRLSPDDLELLFSLLDCFGEVFEEPETYLEKRASPRYLRSLLGDDTFIALVSHAEGLVMGGLVAYELRKFEQKRSEIYIYDLAVHTKFRRTGIATALIEELKKVARDRGAWVIFAQADHVDDPAIQLYSKLGQREEVSHFDIPVKFRPQKTQN